MRTKSVVITGMFAAVLTVLSQIAIPLPSGVPLTLQTFAVALTAYVLGYKKGFAVLLIYLLLGAAGVPVFAGFRGGIGHLLGATGGFLWGFFLLTVFCGSAIKKNNHSRLIMHSVTGLIFCHFLGIIQFMIVMESGLVQAVMMVSLPYIIKDLLSLAGAYMLAKSIRKALRATDAFGEF